MPLFRLKTGKFTEHGLVGFINFKKKSSLANPVPCCIFGILFTLPFAYTIQWESIIIIFQVRDPMPAVYFFLIDVSMNAIQTGATAAACSAIAQAISDLPVSSVYWTL